MFSHLSALAKSATSFSLDDLQDQEDGDDKSGTKKQQQEKYGEPAHQDQHLDVVTSHDKGHVEVSSLKVTNTEESPSSTSVFSNLFDSSSPSKSTTVNINDNSTSNSFTSLFKSGSVISTATIDSSIPDTNTTLSSVSSTFNHLFDSSFSGKMASCDAKEDVDRNNPQSTISEAPTTTTSPLPTKIVKPNPTKTSISSAEPVSSVPPSDMASTGTNKRDATSSVQASPPKSKKGSGREAAKKLEMQLRSSLADVEAALQDKSEQLERVTSLRQQEATEAAGVLEQNTKLYDQIRVLEATIGELEDTSIDSVAQKEELEQEVDALRRDTALQTNRLQELQQQVHELKRKYAGGEEGVSEEDHGGSQQEQLEESLRLLQQELETQASQHAAQLGAAERAAEKKEREWEREKERAKKQQQARLAATEQKTQTLMAEVTSLLAQLEAQEAAAEALKEGHETSLRGQVELHRASLTEIQEERDALKAALERTKEENKSLANAMEVLQENKQSLQTELTRLQGGFEEASRAAASSRESQSTLEAQAQEEVEAQKLLVSELQEQLRISTTKHSELKEKFSLFTEKTKTQVKKFIESQKASEEERQAVANALEARESEVTSLRLKLDNVDQSLKDRKAMSSELAERYTRIIYYICATGGVRIVLLVQIHNIVMCGVMCEQVQRVTERHAAKTRGADEQRRLSRGSAAPLGSTGGGRAQPDRGSQQPPRHRHRRSGCRTAAVR